MTWHDVEILFAAVVLCYSLSVMLGLALRGLWFALENLIGEWVER